MTILSVQPNVNKSFLNLSQETSESKIIMTRTDFISKNFFTDSGAPFLFEGRDYLLPIYNIRFRYLVIMSSRQAEKSSFLSKDMLSDSVLNANDSLLFVTAQQPHADEFVRRKINRQFDMNPALAQEYLGPGCINNVRDKTLSNGTTLSFRAVGLNPDSARGIPARKIYFDETQSIQTDNIPIVMECAQAFPDDSAYLFAGTPLSTKNILTRKYYESKQFEWLITCKCGHRNPPLGMEHIDSKKPYLFCITCGKKMDPQNGEWVSMNPESELAGFRICRLMTPTCRWRSPANDGVLDKLKMYSEAQFHQEVLGLPFDVGVMPVTEQEIYSCCDDFEFLDPNNPPSWI